MKALFFILLINSSYSKNCSLFHNEMKIEVKMIKNGCEFPEGNKVKCAQIISHKKNQEPKVGPLIFRENINFQNFCLVGKKRKIPNTQLKGRIISESGPLNLYALMKCPSEKNTAKIYLYNQKKVKKCILSF